MSAQLPTGQEFAACVDDTFALQLPTGQTLSLVLTAFEDRGSWKQGDRVIEQFSLFFSGPPEPVLQQAIYQLRHERLGAHDIFIVPIGRTDAGVTYQVVFN